MKKQTLYTGIAVALALVVIAYFFINSALAPKNIMPGDQNQSLGSATTTNPADQPQTLPTPPPNSVLIQDVTKGTGAIALKGMTLSVNYIGKLQNGTVFDQSSSHGGPFQFTLGAGQVIPGWEQGIMGMKVGGERILIIPPALGYGAQQVGSIPPNSTLIFDVQLAGVSTTTGK